MLPPRRLVGLPLCVLALALTALPAGWSADASTPSASAGGADPSLPHAAHGQQAITLLGDQLDEAARLNGWTPGRLRDVLATDATAWVDGAGRVYYVDPVAPARADAVEEPQAAAPFPLADTFLLHSKPGSNLTLLIDFDGATVSGTLWNDPPPNGKSLPNGDHPAWTLDADATTFNVTEREAIQSIWQRVAEDYAPFNIDVTTQDPGAAGIERANLTDTVYGTRALVTPSDTAQTAICGGPTCGGVAYVNVFGQLGSTYQPAWVFPQSLGDSKSIAEAVSHEVGHNFGLQHDGTTVAQTLSPCAGATDYYCGHDLWAPIMGVGYYRPVSQWSKGEYANASNTGQDDVALIAAKAPYRTDESGGTVGSAASGLPPVGYLGTATDLDTFRLGACSGTVTLSATGAAVSPNLDLRLELLDVNGTPVAASNPTSAFVDTDTASGLSASISTTVTGGVFYARVDGIGNGTGATGYTDYGSIGAYTMTSAGCSVPATAPGVPTSLQVTPSTSGTAATVTWSAPATDGGSAVTGYTVSRSGLPSEDQVTLTKTWTGLTPGTTYQFSVAAMNLIGTGAAAAQSVTMPTVPSAPTGLQVAPAPNGESASVTWSPPATDNGSTVTGYTVTRTGSTAVEVGAVSSHVWTGLTPGATYTFTVAAVNGAGRGAPASASASLPVPSPPPTVSPPPVTSAPTAPGAPPIGKARSGRVGGKVTAKISWSAPTSTGGSALTGYRVLVFKRGTSPFKTFSVGAAQTAYQAKLKLGKYRFAVVAINTVGLSAQSAVSKQVLAQ